MARTYAGVLGLLAMLTAMARAGLHGGGGDSTLLAAWCGLWVFAAVGYVVGRWAEWMVDMSVRTRIEAEIAAEEARDAAQTTTASHNKPGKRGK